MRQIHYSEVIEVVAQLCQESNFYLPEDVLNSLRKARSEEKSPLGRIVLAQILENAQIAAEEKVPICQDCGTAIVFLELGEELEITGGNLNLYAAIEEGVRRGYKEGYLRKSICHPFTRKNTGDNTPAMIYTDIVPGNKLKIIFCPKGGGSENMSAIKMLSPSEGIEGVKKFVIETVKSAGANPCPPIVVGVGIGGTFERVALLAKKALLRPFGSQNTDTELAALEDELLEEINYLGIGPAGLGGSTTALSVHIEMQPCHIASLPVAININCHAARHKEVTI
ncbi:fumarate hydratase subunit alpha [ANME-1 cluster archaeon GoMg3.2]|nr:fumarate hydratase subunit alpha [ANME-1 cluster archaeon GoMg3.2]